MCPPLSSFITLGPLLPLHFLLSVPCPFCPLSPLSLSLSRALHMPLCLPSPTSVTPSLPKPSVAPSLSSLCPFIRSVLLSPISLCLCPHTPLSLSLLPSLPPVSPSFSPSVSLSPLPLPISLCLSLSPSSLSLSQSWLCCPPLQPFLWLLMSRGAFEVARAEMGGSLRGGEGGSCCQGPNEAPSAPLPR